MLKDCLPHIFHVFRNKDFNKISLYNMLYFHNKLYKFLKKCIVFFDNYAMKNNLQNKMQITFSPWPVKNIDSDHVCLVIMYR